MGAACVAARAGVRRWQMRPHHFCAGLKTEPCHAREPLRSVQKRLIPSWHTWRCHVSCRGAVAEAYDARQLVKMVGIARKQPIQLVISAEHAQYARFTCCARVQSCLRVSEQVLVSVTPAHVTCDQMTGTACLVSPQVGPNQGEIKARSHVCGAVRHLLRSYQRLCVWFCSHVSSTNTGHSRAPRSCSFEAPALNHGRNARVANPTKRAPNDAMRADRASAAQPTIEVTATARRQPRAICHTERTSVRQNVQGSA